MNLGKKKASLRQSLSDAWQLLERSVGELQGDCQIKPATSVEIFTVKEDGDNSMRVDIRPIVFRLSEAASNKLKRRMLYVFLQGKLNFSIDSYDPFLSCHFKTEVGYFREKNDKELVHVLGVHYDFDDRLPAHPIYHAQMTDFANVGLEAINLNYGTQFVVESNRMKDAPERVRLPTAHMDPLSVFVQILADHLINQNASEQQEELFQQTRKALMFFHCDPKFATRLDEVAARQCYRGARWYPTKEELANRQTAATERAAAVAAAAAAQPAP